MAPSWLLRGTSRRCRMSGHAGGPGKTFLSARPASALASAPALRSCNLPRLLHELTTRVLLSHKGILSQFSSCRRLQEPSACKATRRWILGITFMLFAASPLLEGAGTSLPPPVPDASLSPQLAFPCLGLGSPRSVVRSLSLLSFRPRERGTVGRPRPAARSCVPGRPTRLR